MFCFKATGTFHLAVVGLKSLPSVGIHQMLRFRLQRPSASNVFVFAKQAGTGARRDSKNNRKRDGEETFEFVEFAIEEESVRGYERQLQEEYERRAKEKQEPEGVGGLVRRTLQQQVAALKPFLNEGYLKEIGYGDDMASDIEFKDIDYTSVLNSKNAKQKLTANKGVHKVYGSPNPHLPMSEKQCMGCGALMHCVDPSIPGYLPSEKFTAVLQQSEEEVICQRCFFLIHHQKALNVSVSKEEYRNIVSNIRAKKGLVIFMVDILDLPNSVFPELLDVVGENKKILVLGNKIDLLPGDSPGYLKRIKGQLMNYCTNAGINRNGNITDVRLISAKTAYGVEELVSALQSSWKYKGDVYLVGATNAGKSTLFNTLLQSDYSKAKASEIIKEATISPWPGTTLNLLKFPIINPTPYRMFKRQERLKRDSAKAEDDLDEEELKHLKSLKNKSYIVGRVGRTFKVQSTKQEDFMFDADLLSIKTDEDDKPLPGHAREKPNFTYNELKDANWLYDTPGIVKENCVLNHLNDKEVKMVLATQAIIPRTFVLQPGMTLFLGALGRIDFLQAEKSAWFSVIASNLLPVHITNTCKADDIYQKHAGKILLGVPTGGEQRMKAFPPFVPVDVTLKGIGPSEAVADLQLSTAGWVAVTAHSGEHLDLRCYTPRGTSLTIRRPPLLPFIVNIKGERIRKSPAYATKKPSCVVKNFK